MAKRRGRPRKQNVKRHPCGRVVSEAPRRDLGSAGTQALKTALEAKGIRMEKATLVVDLLHEIGKIDDAQYHAGLRYRWLWATVMPHGPRRTGKPGDSSGSPLNDEEVASRSKELQHLEGGLSKSELREVRAAVIYNNPPRALVVERHDDMRIRPSDERSWTLLIDGINALERSHHTWERRKSSVAA